MRLAWVFLGFFALWLLLDRSATMLGSMRGEWGAAIALAVLAAAVLVELLVAKRRPREALKALGLGAPKTRALFWTLALCAALLAFFPIFAIATGTEITLRADAAVLAAGMFAQGGIAEETIFRGFLFRHVREGRPLEHGFWRAAFIAAIPFAAVHLLLFLTMDFAVALAALVVSLSLTFPLAWLFERAGDSIWPPAILHAVVQGGIKVVETENFQTLAMAWMAVATLAPWLLLLMRPKDA